MCIRDRYCGQTAGWIKLSLGMEVGLSPGDFVLDDSAPPQKRVEPQFSPHVYCGQTAEWMKMLLSTEVALDQDDNCVRWVASSPALKGHSPQFSENVRCGETAGWTNSTWYGGRPRALGPGDCVRWGLSSSQKKGTAPAKFWPILLPNGCMDEDATLYGSIPRARPHCVRRGPSSPAKGAQQLPLFSAHLSYCRAPVLGFKKLLKTLKSPI